MTTLNASIVNLQPRYLFLVRWLCKLIGATCRAWTAKPRLVKHDPPNTASNYDYDPSVSSSSGPHSVGHP